MTMPGASSVPAGNSHQRRLAADAGRRSVAMAIDGLRPSEILSAASFRNAVVAMMALGGSTNATIHLPAIAGRAGIDVPLSLFDEIARDIPVLANVEPSGDFLMEDFFEAGGLRALLQQIRQHLDTSCLTVNGQSLGENIAGATVFRPEVIRQVDDPVQPLALAVLHGNLAPDGAVIKVSAASPDLCQHRGPAVVFAGPDGLGPPAERPRTRCHGRVRARPPECRASGWSRHARVGDDPACRSNSSSSACATWSGSVMPE